VKASADFARNALKMMLGTGIAQLLPLAAAPLMTRIYSPAEYGALGLLVGVSSVISVVGTGRLELALVIAEDDVDARKIVSLSTRLLVVISALSGLVVAALEFMGFSLVANSESELWAYALAPTVAAMGAAQIATSWLNRFREYGAIATGNVLLQVVYNGWAIVAGILKGGAIGLVSGRLIAQLVMASYAWATAKRRAALAFADRGAGQLGDIARKYYQFPLFNMPNSLASIVTRDLVVFAFSFLGQLADAGLFTLTRSFVYVPVSFLSTSLSQVYYREAHEFRGTRELEQLTADVCRALAMIFSPVFVGVVWFGGDIFAVIFGEPWRSAGVYAALLAPVGYLMLFSSWPERIFEVSSRQWIPLAIQSLFLVISTAVVLATAVLGWSGSTFVSAYAAVQCLAQLGYLAAAFRVAGFRLAVFLPAIAWSVGLACSSAALIALFEFCLPTLLVPVAALSVLGPYYAILIRTGLR